MLCNCDIWEPMLVLVELYMNIIIVGREEITFLQAMPVKQRAQVLNSWHHIVVPEFCPQFRCRGRYEKQRRNNSDCFITKQKTEIVFAMNQNKKRHRPDADKRQKELGVMRPEIFRESHRQNGKRRYYRQYQQIKGDRPVI